MGYRMFDADGVEVVHSDLQNKSGWCEHGASKEEVFVDKYGSRLGVVINPEKKTNPYVLDLFQVKRNMFSDLKTQNTPFFKAQSLHGISPNYAVTFNQKDKIRYEKYLKSMKEIAIFFWVNWIPVRWVRDDEDISVTPTNAIYGIKFSNILKLIHESTMHDYVQRVDDRNGNAKRSYVFDLNNSFFHRLI